MSTATPDRVAHYTRLLTRLFREAPSKHDAHARSRPLLHEMACDRAFQTAALARHLQTPGALARKNYPTVTLSVALTAEFGLHMNCWIPLPGRQTDVSTKAIHHHGNMLLTTATAFGPGYEHWTFRPPRLLDARRELYALTLLERKRHALHGVDFVDSYIPHLPVYPASLTITLALWSSKNPTTWRDHLKRVPLFKRNEDLFRRLLCAVRLTRALDLKVVEYFDFFPVEDGFKGVKERTEFGLGPNADYLHSLFHVLQQTGNEGLAPLIERQLDGGVVPENRGLVVRLLGDLRAGRPIEGRLSEGHYNVPGANFTTAEVERALASLAATGAAATAVPG
jgi:hypothetical protein